MTETLVKEVHVLKFDPELQNLLVPLTTDEHERLEESILAEGVRDPIMVWGETVVDGHNRYQVCHQHNIPFAIRHVEFANKEAVKIWMVRNQLGRRNLMPADRVKLASMLREHLEREARGRQAQGGKEKLPQDLVEAHEEPKDPRAGEVDKQIADIAGLSPETVRRHKKVMAEGDEDTKAKVASGEWTINKGYDILTGKKPKPEPVEPTAPETNTNPPADEEVDEEPIEVTGIKKIGTMDYVVSLSDGSSVTMPRAELLRNGYRKCPHCSGHGVERKEVK